jgi:hypothetical protein
MHGWTAHHAGAIFDDRMSVDSFVEMLRSVTSEEMDLGDREDADPALAPSRARRIRVRAVGGYRLGVRRGQAQAGGAQESLPDLYQSLIRLGQEGDRRYGGITATTGAERNAWEQ